MNKDRVSNCIVTKISVKDINRKPVRVEDSIEYRESVRKANEMLSRYEQEQANMYRKAEKYVSI